MVRVCASPEATALPVALAPAVSVLHCEPGSWRAVFVHDFLGELENQQILGTQRNIQFATKNEILLHIVLVRAVNEGIAAERVTSIERSPHAGREGVADVS